MGSNLSVNKEIEEYINNHSLKLNQIQKDCENTMGYPPTTKHMEYLAKLGASNAVQNLKQITQNDYLRLI